MSLWLIAGTAIFFVALALLAEARDAEKRRKDSQVSQDEWRSMEQDEDLEFFAETDTEEQEEK